jgi:hypothetical protein
MKRPQWKKPRGRSVVLIFFPQLMETEDRRLFMETEENLRTIDEFISELHDLDPEILLIDEILAVGDMEFQKKCIDKVMGFKKLR